MKQHPWVLWPDGTKTHKPPESRNKLAWFFKDLYYGVYYGYPPCCVVAYTIHGVLNNWKPNTGRFGGTNNQHIPCMVFHKPNHLDIGMSTIPIECHRSWLFYYKIDRPAHIRPLQKTEPPQAWLERTQ